MKTVKSCSVCLVLLVMACAGSALGMPLNSSARTVVPADLQQLISVDYRALRDSATAVALKRQLMDSQKNLEEFEGALRGIGINPDKDIDTLALASFRTPKQGVQTIGVAGGPYNIKAVLKKLTAAKIKPTKYHDTSNIYPMDGGFVMTFLDDSTLMFGEPGAVRSGLDARDGYIPNLDTNETMSDMMTSVDSSPFWSILDQQGTQNMMRSALGDAARIADYETVKKRVLGSYYTMDFSSGVDFQLTVVTSDSMSAGTLSMLLKAAILFMKASATPVEKAAMDQAAIDSDGQNMTVHFKDSDAQFQSLMHSQLFASLSH